MELPFYDQRYWIAFIVLTINVKEPINETKKPIQNLTQTSFTKIYRNWRYIKWLLLLFIFVRYFGFKIQMRVIIAIVNAFDWAQRQPNLKSTRQPRVKFTWNIPSSIGHLVSESVSKGKEGLKKPITFVKNFWIRFFFIKAKTAIKKA